MLPDSPGEIVSRFRDDVEELMNFIDNWLDLSGQALFSLIALGIMLRINVLVTLSSFYRWWGSLRNAYAQHTHQKNRRANRETTDALRASLAKCLALYKRSRLHRRKSVLSNILMR
jgi:ATP-binding cassette subfamily B protein